MCGALGGQEGTRLSPEVAGMVCKMQRGGKYLLCKKRREKRYICNVSGFLSSALKCLLSTKLNEIITFISGNVVFLSPRCVRISCFFLSKPPFLGKLSLAARKKQVGLLSKHLKFSQFPLKPCQMQQNSRKRMLTF